MRRNYLDSPFCSVARPAIVLTSADRVAAVENVVVAARAATDQVVLAVSAVVAERVARVGLVVAAEWVGFAVAAAYAAPAVAVG